MNLLLLQLRNQITFSRKTVCFGLYIDKICVPDVFSGSPLNTDTRILRALWRVPLVSVLTGFDCNLKTFPNEISIRWFRPVTVCFFC